jgi:hypothetical protein
MGRVWSFFARCQFVAENSRIEAADNPCFWLYDCKADNNRNTAGKFVTCLLQAITPYVTGERLDRWFSRGLLHQVLHNGLHIVADHADVGLAW